MSALLPWFRGEKDAAMEQESYALCKMMEEETFESKVVISLDVHSGFGWQDQLWFPYAKSLAPFYHLPEMMRIKDLLDRTYPYHIYKVEPQAKNYVTHGDLWDYLYDKRLLKTKSVYLPLCLEMGSWTWVKKNPKQIFRSGGIFDPILPHRRHRAMRRHFLLFDFLVRLISNPKTWAELSENARKELQIKASELWFY